MAAGLDHVLAPHPRAPRVRTTRRSRPRRPRTASCPARRNMTPPSPELSSKRAAPHAQRVVRSANATPTRTITAACARRPAVAASKPANGCWPQCPARTRAWEHPDSVNARALIADQGPCRWTGLRLVTTRCDKGVTSLNHVNDQVSGLSGIVVTGTIRDSLSMLDGLLDLDGGQRRPPKRVYVTTMFNTFCLDIDTMSR